MMDRETMDKREKIIEEIEKWVGSLLSVPWSSISLEDLKLILDAVEYKKGDKR